MNEIAMNEVAMPKLSEIAGEVYAFASETANKAWTCTKDFINRPVGKALLLTTLALPPILTTGCSMKIGQNLQVDVPGRMYVGPVAPTRVFVKPGPVIIEDPRWHRGYYTPPPRSIQRYSLPPRGHHGRMYHR